MVLSSGPWLTWTSFRLPAPRSWTLGCLPALGHRAQMYNSFGTHLVFHIFFSISISREVLFCFQSCYSILVFLYLIPMYLDQREFIKAWTSCTLLTWMLFSLNIWNYFCRWYEVNISLLFFLLSLKWNKSILFTQW